MTKTYEEIISVVRGDIKSLENALLKDIAFPNNSLEELLLAPAKRIRSVLAFLFLRALGTEITSRHIAYQAAIEIAHTASLIHDDIIDLNNNRRGNVTLNAQFGDKIAVLTGDYLLSIALKKIITNSDIINNFLDVFSGMAQGEVNQYFTRNTIPTPDDYIKKTIYKTANLFSLALHSLSEDFGLNFGIAFQIKNDLKDIDEDIKNGIYTAPVIYSGSINVTETGIQKTKDLINYYLNMAENEIKNLPVNKYSKAIHELLELYKEC